jgi:hypothetical protein
VGSDRKGSQPRPATEGAQEGVDKLDNWIPLLGAGQPVNKSEKYWQDFQKIWSWWTSNEKTGAPLDPGPPFPTLPNVTLLPAGEALREPTTA